MQGIEKINDLERSKVVAWLKTQLVPIDKDATQWRVRFEDGSDFDLIELFILFGEEKLDEGYEVL